ncbi:uncharacterized protein EI97DRAFT_184079 [Westerdykella ornata]|uniref:SWR1-complex protein 4 n=1 Tax=Westerdykella ornata TaxID=318751 RepID=A0A6A6JT00_WESOR|nr:uncharacterized protein EI97DRAFT_184079 [Westerdykella ornata]KAF2279692.1 hypothetical protein EI97DRAFT_184079 [Westerdykella ornata]
MATGRDVRDIFGLPAGSDATKTAVPKRAKPAAPAKPRIQGVAREVAALYGERPPPVAVYEEKKAYRPKRNTGPAKQWVEERFTNQARSDGLVLRHWRRKDEWEKLVAQQQDGDISMDTSSLEVQPIVSRSDFVKYNVEVDMPTFTDEEYDAHLRSDDWSREETDYLLSLVKDYAYRWPVIWDRYDFQPGGAQGPQEKGDSNALSTMPFAPTKARTVEDLKARFYDISARLMRLRIPEVQMDAEQYQLYETLQKYNPHSERNRKELAAALMNRSMDEVKEEEFLLTELQRINMAASRLDAERDELRARLETPIPNPGNAPGLQSFHTSAGLQQLFNQLVAQEKNKKKAAGPPAPGGRLNLSTTEAAGTPTTNGQAAQQLAANRRTSMAQPPPPTPVRQLSPQAEYRFNVSTHDRLTSGVSFGSDKLLKMRQAKSNVQTQKIAAALAELGISEIISIPTSRVAEVFEQLVSKVGKLLDVRKVREKEEGECRVLEAMKAQKEAKENGMPAVEGSGRGNAGSAAAVKREEVGETPRPEEMEVDGEGEEDADGEADEDEGRSKRGTSEAVSTSTRARKRSASVLSQASTKSTKRARK